ncbi:MAG: ribosome maturation factor RimP [Bdellovibrionaceae bacterium]|nr:ribosome maturation factor RimP [Pseudobdellovibrionaceae bacterium]
METSTDIKQLDTMETLVKEVVERKGCIFYALEQFRRGQSLILRVFIDHKEGINVDHCESVSQALSLQLDVADFISQAYELEVSSPGLDRKLIEPWHFNKVVGQSIKIICEKEANKTAKVKATLLNVSSDGVCLDKEGFEDVKWKQIKKANLVY